MLRVYPYGVVTDGTGNEQIIAKNGKDLIYGSKQLFNHIEGDKRINDLFFQWRTNNYALRNDTEFKLKAIEIIDSLYGDFGRWLRFQFECNYLMHGLNLDFLKDTLRFILQGTRQYSVMTFKEIVEINPDYIVGISSQARWDSLCRDFSLSSTSELNNYIGMWCSHDGGFDDMLYTTWILFGSAEGTRPIPTNK